MDLEYRLNAEDVKLQIDSGHASLHGQASRGMRLIGGGTVGPLPKGSG